MRQSTVDLAALVRDVQKEVLADAQGRHIEWKIHELPPVKGDPALLRVVLSNLLANAVKFTRERERAVIEIGARRGASGKTEAFVRDNGAGFDMRYVDKLFGVFQRLHRSEEFEGTGIGLATVRRIIARHDGTVRAEGTLGQGASFYFSLPSA
jgi:light-regulated signal transduction histidine kinase (bacteriophytochrome)